VSSRVYIKKNGSLASHRPFQTENPLLSGENAKKRAEDFRLLGEKQKWGKKKKKSKNRRGVQHSNCKKKTRATKVKVIKIQD